MGRISPRHWILIVVSALLQLLPFPLAGPVPAIQRYVAYFCLVPFLMALQRRGTDGKQLSVSASALLGYGCGFLWFLGNCYWIYQTMFFYGGLPPLAAMGILVLFSLYLGLYFAGFGAMFAVLQHLFRSQKALLLAGPLWVAVELARARITGFPWDLLGYTAIDNSILTTLAPLTGVMGLSLLMALGNALWLWRPSPSVWFLGPALAMCLLLTGLPNTARTPPAPDRAVLLQENLGVGRQSAEGMPESQAEMLQSFAALTAAPLSPEGRRLLSSAAAPAQLIAWPEAPTSFEDADPRLRAALGTVSRAEHAPLVVDAVGQAPSPNGSRAPQEFVSASFYLPDGSYAGRYDKMHLVPFGEYTPYKQLFFFAGHLLDGLNFVPGTGRRLFSVGGHRFGTFICYESIFGDEVREFARSGAQVFVNLSDDGWYGDTSAPWEHLDMARMRAIENRRWLLRATNTGVTASIDPYGHIVAALPRHIREAISVPFGFRSDVTFYTRHGDWIGWLCAIVIVSATVGEALQRRFPRQPAKGR